MNKGDSIYFQTAQGPKSGCVRAIGRHGATVECDGKHHKVRHEHVLGVKQRLERKFKMVDQGEEGSLVEDEAGSRSYIAGRMPEAEGYLDKLTALDTVDDGDLVTRRIEREMHGTRSYQVLASPLPAGTVYVGESQKRAVRLLGHLDAAGLAAPYEAVSRTQVQGDDEKQGVLFAFTPEDDQLQDFVNAVAGFQRKSALDAEDIMVVGRQVGGMREAVLSSGEFSGRPVLVLGDRDGFDSQPVYVSADLEATMKAMTLDNATILFMKAGPIKNRAGLSLQEVTDKMGRTEKRWKRTSEPMKKERRRARKDESTSGGQSGSNEQPDMKHGDSVEFQAGNAKGNGEIVASGKDGATVKDQSGREHKVHWDDLTDHTPKEGENSHAGSGYPEKQDGEADKAYLKRVKGDLNHLDKLPEEHDKFFNMDGATVVPMDKLVSGKTDEENKQGGNNSPKFMMAAYHGRVAKRDPISVEKMPDGKFKILDGNGTYTSAKKYGWKSMPVKVVDGDTGESKNVWDKNALFSDKEMAIPKEVIQQNVSSWDDLVKQATAGLAEYKQWLGGIAGKQKWQIYDDDYDAAIASMRSGEKGIKVLIADLKGEERAAEKVETEPDGWAGLKDIVRGTVAVDSLDQLPEVLDLLRQSGMTLARRPKNRFAEPTDEGYRDIMLNIEMPGGHIAELQVNTKKMIMAKDEAHVHYEEIRTLTEAAKKEGRSLSPNEGKRVDKLTEESIRIYGDAWEKDAGSHENEVTNPMSKAILFMSRRVK